MKRVGIFLLISIFLASFAAAHHDEADGDGLPLTIYDPLAKKNIPLWSLSEERLEELIELKISKLDKWSRINSDELEALKDKIGYGSYKRDTVVTKTYNPEPQEREKTIKERIAEEFGIKTIYDPVKNRNIPVHYLTKDELVSLLNNPTSQLFTFGSTASIDEKLKKMGLKGEVKRSFKKSEYRKNKVFTPNHKMGPAPTYGLVTKMTNWKKTDRTYNNKVRIGNYEATYGEPLVGDAS